MAVRDRVELRPRSAVASGLLAAASPIDGDWWRGVTFSGNGCAEPAMRGQCEEKFNTGLDDLVAGEVGDVETAVPVTVLQGIRCSTLSNAPLAELAEARLDYATEWVAGHVLQTGEHSDHTVGGSDVSNPALIDGASVVAGPTSPVDALAALDAAGAQRLYGAPVTIHVPPQLATHLLAASAIWRDGRTWRTAAGSLVIVSPGYTGVEMYVTGEVYAMSGERATRTDVDRRINDVTSWATSLVLATFDPCWHGRITTDLTEVVVSDGSP